MAYRMDGCYYCGKPGHIKKFCPQRKCNICKQFGHIQYDCPAYQQTSRTPGPSSGRYRTERGTLARNQSCGQTRMPASRWSGKNTATTRPVSSSIRASIVDSFFQQHRTVGTESWLGYSHQVSATCYSPYRWKSSDPPSLSLPRMDKDMQSNIRSVETVKRVAETIYEMLKDDIGPIQILVDKPFSDFQENNNPGLLTIPERESDLKKGDFDIIIIHRDYGYIHLEVKAFGDAQEDLTEEEKVQKLVKVLRERTVDRLHKGRQALKYLQPPGKRVNIVNTIAFPNVTRDLLRRALQKDIKTRKKLTDCISPSGKPTVEELCLCSDDLPPKDGLVDGRDPDIKKAIRTWWSLITTLGARNPELSPDAYRLILASFFNNEDVKTLPQVVQDIGDRFEHVWLDEHQAEVLMSEKQYMYIAGPPGSGKTLLLARKAVLWLHEKRSVFVLYLRGNTNQSATEFLCHFMKMVTGSDNDVDLSSLRKIHVSDFSRLKDVLTEILQIKEDDRRGRDPGYRRHQSQDSHSSEELSVSHEELQKFFSPAAQVPAYKTPTDVTATEKGENICVIIDEINMRVIKGESKELLKAIRKRFPAAKIWCAGQLPSHKPGKFFHMEQLVLPYRCTPKTQRLLQALEPFCRNALQQPIFNYVTSSTSPSCNQHRLPADGLDPVFFSHEGHGLGEIYDCPACARALTTYLKDTLKIGQKDTQGKGLEESDVLIAVNSTALFNNMQALVYTPLYRELTSETANFTVHVYRVGDIFHLDGRGICLMHTRMVAGMEKKVVVSIPCKQHQAKAVPARTYAEVVKGSSATSAATTPVLIAPSQIGPSPGSSLVPSQGHEEIPSSGSGLAQDQNHPKEDQIQDQNHPKQDQSHDQNHPKQDQSHDQNHPKQDQSPAAQQEPSSGPAGTTLPQDHQGTESDSPALEDQDSPGYTRDMKDSHYPSRDMENTHRHTRDLKDIHHHMKEDSELPIRDILHQCQTLTQNQRDKLARLGHLNLHWLWYSISRSLAHNVVFHF